MKEKEVKIILRTGLKNSCAAYDPFGMDTVVECFGCENCDYLVVDHNNQVIKDFKFPNVRTKYSKQEIFTAEFIDAYNKNDIETDLKNEESDYWLIRKQDNEIMKFSKAKLKEINDERDKTSARAIEKEERLHPPHKSQREIMAELYTLISDDIYVFRETDEANQFYFYRIDGFKPRNVGNIPIEMYQQYMEQKFLSGEITNQVIDYLSLVPSDDGSYITISNIKKEKEEPRKLKQLVRNFFQNKR